MDSSAARGALLACFLGGIVTVLCCISTFVLYILYVGSWETRWRAKKDNIWFRPLPCQRYDLESGPQLSSLCLRTRATNNVTSYTINVSCSPTYRLLGEPHVKESNQLYTLNWALHTKRLNWRRKTLFSVKGNRWGLRTKVSIATISESQVHSTKTNTNRVNIIVLAAMWLIRPQAAMTKAIPSLIIVLFIKH